MESCFREYSGITTHNTCGCDAPGKVKMSLKFEQKWKTSLISILEELSNSEYKKMLLNLDKIPKRLKSGRSREEMPQIITQYYGVEQSVLAIKKVMDLIPRKDAAVQDRLQPFVDKLKKKGQTKNKDKKESGKPDKTKTISALKSSGQLLDSEAIVGKVVHKSDVHTDVNKDNETESFFNLVVADKTGSIKVMVYGTERFKDIKEKSCYMFKKVIVDENFIKVTSLTTVSKTTAIKIPAKVQREAQMIIDQEPASSKAQTSAQKMPVTVQGTVTGIGPGKPVKSKLEKIGTQSKGIKVTPKTTKMLLKFEQKWKTSLISILEELSNSEYKKMLLNLDKIPKRLKSGRSREEMPQIITQYYGVKQSVLAIKKVMDLIPRKDAAVQDRLQPFVDQLKKKHQTKNKDKKESGKPDETKTISALKSSGQLLDTEAIVGKVVHKSDLRTYVRKDNTTGSFFNLVVADKTGSIKVMVYGTERFKDIKEKSCYMFKKVIVDENFIKVTSLTTVSKRRAIKIPAKVQREAQMIIDLKAASSMVQTSAQKMPVNVQ
ncbi:uncharacterized protein LOC122995839 [Thunnus albacares]|uniref:uncharacterized protein LOC122995839 n=1 Tax=Thunnus albacares TaxID=8236 RepID=UPI001CF696D1|nr:uncharacterized protein LOC122995839 [Thunnus albacares]